MEDVAREAGVSRALVSLVMRDQPNVSKARRRRVLEVAGRLGYRPNAMARSLASRRTRTVGVMLDDLRNPFFAEIAGGVEELASELGYQLLLERRRPARPPRARGAVDAARVPRRRGDPGQPPDARPPTSSPQPPRCRSCSSAVRSAARTPTCVVIDEQHGTGLVLDHLLGLGHERIAHVDGGRGAGGPQRRSSYLRGMRARRLGARARVIPGDFTEEAGAAAARQLLAEPELPTAVFAANDLVAAGLLGEFDRAGVDVPGDDLDRRLRQHLDRPPRARVTDDGGPAAHRDGPDGARAAAGPDRAPPPQPRAADRADARRPLHDRRAARRLTRRR